MTTTMTMMIDEGDCDWLMLDAWQLVIDDEGDDDDDDDYDEDDGDDGDDDDDGWWPVIDAWWVYGLGSMYICMYAT